MTISVPLVDEVFYEGRIIREALNEWRYEIRTTSDPAIVAADELRTESSGTSTSGYVARDIAASLSIYDEEVEG